MQQRGMNSGHFLWRTESDGGTQVAWLVLALLAGAALMIGFRAFEGPGLTGGRAGFALGVLLLAGGVLGLLLCGRQIITVDPDRRCIVMESISRYGSKSEVLPFEDIADVSLGQTGDKEGGSIRYHVVVRQRSGGEKALFVGFFAGASDRTTVQARCQRLANYLSAASSERSTAGS
jgi:hypothetical protein